MGQLLGEHLDQRHDLAADPSLIASAIEETLRYQPPSPVQARCVARDVELYGHTVTKGSYRLLLNGSANRDETKFVEPDRYDIHRKGGHLSFGQGLHFWEVDYANSPRARTSRLRGRAQLPVKTGQSRCTRSLIPGLHAG